MLLTADWHLTDNPTDEYRWDVFKALRSQLDRSQRPVLILGDLTDRKDRHSAALVNRLVSELSMLAREVPPNFPLTILMGNHDKPLNGTPFWQFMNQMPNTRFITQPFADEDRLFLPYSSNPLEDWKDIPYHRYKVIFLHQTVTGALGNNGVVLENNNMPVLPRGVKIYSGDIHTPQVVGRVTYVGAPHPVAFGDTYPCRFLKLDSDYAISEEITLTPPKKLMLRVSSLEELERASTLMGDQARVIYKLPLSALDEWPTIQDKIAHWARLRRVSVASCEPDIVSTSALSSEEELAAGLDFDPETVLRSFAEAESIDDSTLEVGLDILKDNKQ